jgi:hypothetical protein
LELAFASDCFGLVTTSDKMGFRGSGKENFEEFNPSVRLQRLKIGF